MSDKFTHDVLVIGSGAAGLTLALNLADQARIAVIHKGDIEDSSTRFAQGGIAAVLSDNDTTDAHIADTINAGADLCQEDAVKFTVENSKTAVKWLVEQGVDFSKKTQDDGSQAYHLTKEGGHSHRRIIHSADSTGLAVSSSLIDRAQAEPNIELYEHRVAVDLITTIDPATGKKACSGCYVLDRQEGQVDVFEAKFVILATGGASKVYLYTSNPDGASGDGIAMAWRAGCRVGNMEFNQFHPTCLYHPNAKSFLMTEALRGEGAHLLLPNGERFMHRFDDRNELAPRDIVARAIDHEMKRLGSDCVFLDISHRPSDFILDHFPTVAKRCLEFGIDITKEPIPVVPAAHYTCGGVMVNQHGESDIPNLYVIGEASFTGLHGANRMASNSLLECIVYGQSAAAHIKKQLNDAKALETPQYWDESQVTNSDEDVVISHNWDELRRFMWDYVGIVRTNKRLERAQRRVDLLQLEIHEYYSNYKVTNDLLELRNLAVIADLIIRSAASRKESRGLHFTLDYPEALEEAQDTILTPTNYEIP